MLLCFIHYFLNVKHFPNTETVPHKLTPLSIPQYSILRQYTRHVPPLTYLVLYASILLLTDRVGTATEGGIQILWNNAKCKRK